MTCNLTTGASAQSQANISGFKATADDMISEAQNALDELARNQSLNIYGAPHGTLPSLSMTYNPVGDMPIYQDTIAVPVFDVPPVSKANISNNLENVGDKPINTAEYAGFNAPVKPGDLTAEAPGEVPNVRDPKLPDDIVLATIADPYQYLINIPISPAINIPDFTAIAPGSDHLVVPGDTFHWSEIDYDSDILQLVQTQVTAFLNGGVGIPNAIWDAIWDRAAEKEDKSGIKLIQEITEEWGARGFSLPQGAQVARIDEARQKILNNRSTLAREIAEKQAVHEIENLKFAVQQGIVLEKMLGDWYQQKTARLLDAAKFAYRATIDLFTADIQLYNTRLDQYKTDAQVYQTLLQAAVTELEVYKAELDAQKLINDINEQNVAIYIAKYKALETQITLFNSQLEAAKTQIAVDTARVTAYKVSVDAYGAVVAAKTQEYDAYIAQLKGEEIIAGIYETEVKAFAVEMDAYKTEVSVAETEKSIEFKNADLNLQEFAADLEQYSANLKAEMGKIEITVKNYDAESKNYELAMKDNMNSISTNLEVEKIRFGDKDAQSKISVANLQGNNERTKAETILGNRANEAIASINAQIGSAAMAAITVGSSISDSASNSCRTDG